MSDLEKLNMWEVELLRLTAFPQPDFEPDKDWWAKIVGEQPDNEKSQPKRGIRQYDGDFENGRLILALQPNRIDWVYRAVESPEQTRQILGIFPEQVQIFQDMIEGWFHLDNCPSLDRLAFGAILHQPVENTNSGYKLLTNRYLRFDADLDDSSDFFYQINRRQQSEVIKNLKINRLMKWSVSKWQAVMVAPVTRTLPAEYSVRLELDINSLQEYQESIQVEEARLLFDEFVSLGKEIAIHGDIS